MEYDDGCLLRCTFSINVYCIGKNMNKLVKEISMYTLKKGNRVFRNKSNYNSKVEIEITCALESSSQFKGLYSCKEISRVSFFEIKEINRVTIQCK